MSNSTPSGGRPLATNSGSSESTTQLSPLHKRKPRSSRLSNERTGGVKPTSSRRRPGTRIEATFRPHTGSSRGESPTMQRSTSPAQILPGATPINYTKTGRISKAKKGLKVHTCECGRSYTRAEHLRRHQKNHNEDAPLICEFPDCRRPFYRRDLLQRHQERHNDPGKGSPQTPLDNNAGAGADSAHFPVDSVSPTGAPSIVPLVQRRSRYQQNSMSPASNTTSDPSVTKPSFPNASQHAANVSISVGDDGLSTGVWGNTFGNSPSYSSSSGYASPVLGDYASIFAHHSYGTAPVRTRTSSNASLEPWGYPSHSPTSTNSTLAYAWPASDKSPVPPTLSFLDMTTSCYPMPGEGMVANMDATNGFITLPGVRSLAQRDEMEQAALFPEEGFGVTHTYPWDQYLDNYWRFFHPTFPLLHRPTLVPGNESPMLRAAMIAVGAQYSSDSCAKRRSRILLNQCIKLLEMRDMEPSVETPRLCDYQAVFLVEVLWQFRALRAAKVPSKRFEEMYIKFAQEYSRTNTSGIVDSIITLDPYDDAVFQAWSTWVSLSSQQRLLQCCYILEYQQATLLARPSHESLIQIAGFELPFPAPMALWDATTSTDWAIGMTQYGHLPSYLGEITSSLNPNPLDHFQSCLLIASHYNHFCNPASYLSAPSLANIDHLVEDSPITRHHLLVAKLLHVTPIRALLSVAGETWILWEKVTSMSDFSGFERILKVWVNGLWSPNDEASGQNAKEALRISIQILQQALNLEHHNLCLELGADMGIYYAVLVIWITTVAANTRINRPHPHTQQTFRRHSPHPSGQFTSNGTTHNISSPTSHSPNPLHPANVGLAAATPPISMLHTDMTTLSTTFLDCAAIELELLNMAPQWPRDVAQWQQGCSALLRWVKMKLRNGSIAEGRDSVVCAGPTSAAGTGRGGDNLGELLDGVVGSLEKLLGRGWEGWAV
ncbi:hypothetical protein GQ43DRAFT_182554 [Delitschia confertaspora ATCC 74209]|uniref:C2H2-type domain-containing protein n=1 Tax=Delitschia confertaspora ATCC 74209 TaxID=1513339 RepID=A0A9P4JSE2_9PLEO|nr:hypothetical protein GQ43DRAFT_182554 [Delitschia confertaspora ATCC 74209]